MAARIAWPCGAWTPRCAVEESSLKTPDVKRGGFDRRSTVPQSNFYSDGFNKPMGPTFPGSSEPIAWYESRVISRFTEPWSSQAHGPYGTQSETTGWRSVHFRDKFPLLTTELAQWLWIGGFEGIHTHGLPLAAMVSSEGLIEPLGS